ncbi:transposase [Candidatus Woesearchaeota archaeon]|nr:transposase [Candidatus Woesearchaeota archaeon]
MEIPKERLLIVKNYSKGMSLRKIGDLLDIPYTKAHYWIKRYDKNKEEGLKTRKQKGRESLLNEKSLEEIKLFLINNKPSRYNGQAAGWNSREVKNYIKQKYNISYSLRHIERLLHKLGFSLIVPRPKNVKASKEKQEEFRQKFKKNLNRNIWVCQ